jgi:LacI family transcriptional regulator
MATTIKDIAREVNMSVAAVSLVLNGKHQGQISEKSRRRILAVAQEMDYYPHAIARGLVSQRSQNICIAFYDVDYIGTPYFSTIVGGATHVAGIEDYNLQFATTTKETMAGRENLFFLRKAVERRADGFIIVEQVVSDEDILKLKKYNIPFVLIDREIHGEDVCTVMADNEEGIFRSTEHLIMSGHRNIIFLYERPLGYKMQSMIRGFKNALRENNIPFTDRMACDLPEAVEIAFPRFLEMFSSRPTAIVCSSDLVCCWTVKRLRKAKIRVPEDISVIGYNDEVIADLMEPPLTTMRVPLRRMGEEAMRMLLMALRGETVTKKLVLKTELVSRSSCQQLK